MGGTSHHVYFKYRTGSCEDLFRRGNRPAGISLCRGDLFRLLSGSKGKVSGPARNCPFADQERGKRARFMSQYYNYDQIERKWQERWAEQSVFSVSTEAERPKYYVLEMLPYPSGALHLGHVRNYSLGDSVARFKRLQGYNVLHPIGWDAFGLPAENAAIKNQIPAEKWTLDNIERMKVQCKRLGFSYDWDREIATCLPDYYHWNQW